MQEYTYKYGGTTKSTHTNCPARVLQGGRCPKECPLFSDHESRGHCDGLAWIDHPHVISEEGNEIFVSVHYSDPKEYIDSAKAYLDFHGIKVDVITQPFKGMKDAWHVHFSTARRTV